MTAFTVEVAGVEYPATRGDYEEPPVDVMTPPTAGVDVMDPDGSAYAALAIGAAVDVKRDGVVEFPGVVETRQATVSATGGRWVHVGLVHAGYLRLRRKLCDTYVYDENDRPLGTRDAVKVNPWRYFIFRDREGALDANGEAPPVDGVGHADVLRCLLGTRLIIQYEFLDASGLLPSSLTATANGHIYATSERGDVNASLQPADPGVGPATVVTVALESGDPNVDAMGDISRVDVLVIGEIQPNMVSDPKTAVTVRALRNARTGGGAFTGGDADTYDADYLGTGLQAWTKALTTFAPAGPSVPKNSLGVEVGSVFDLLAPGPASDGVTRVRYVKIVATIAGDTGLSEGTIDEYDDVSDASLDADWVSDDYAGLNRLQALDRLRKDTVSRAALNPSPHWDAWVDADLAVHFRERRGATKTSPDYRAEQGDVTLLEYEEDATHLAYQTVGVGGGRGDAELVLVDKAEFSAGGLYDADRDPAGATRLYGDLPAVAVYRDQSVRDFAELRRRARAYHKYRRSPSAQARAELIAFLDPDVETGDDIHVVDPTWSLDRQIRIVRLGRAWDADAGETLAVELGDPTPDAAAEFTRLRIDRERAADKPAPTTGQSPGGGKGVHFTKDVYGRFAFAVPDRTNVQRVLLKMRSIPWVEKGGSSFTVQTFKGDTPGANPFYASQVRFAVDPTVDAATDEPTAFEADRHLVKWGSTTAAVEVTVDVTNLLRKLSNDRIAPEHVVYFLSEAVTNNAQGLGAVDVTPILKTREDAGT